MGAPAACSRKPVRDLLDRRDQAAGLLIMIGGSHERASAAPTAHLGGFRQFHPYSSHMSVQNRLVGALRAAGRAAIAAAGIFALFGLRLTVRDASVTWGMMALVCTMFGGFVGSVVFLGHVLGLRLVLDTSTSHRTDWLSALKWALVVLLALGLLVLGSRLAGGLLGRRLL